MIQQPPQPGGQGRTPHRVRQPAGTPDFGKRLNRVMTRHRLPGVQVNKLHLLPPRLRKQLIHHPLRLLEHRAELVPGQTLLRLPGNDRLFHRLLHQILHRRAPAGIPQHPAERIPPAHLRHISVGKRGIHGRSLKLRIPGLFRPDAFLGFLPCLHKGPQRNMLAQGSIHAGGGLLITHPFRLQGADSGHRHIRAGLHLPQRLRGNHHPFGPCLFIRHCARNHLRRVKTPLGKSLAHGHIPGQQMLRPDNGMFHIGIHKRLQISRHLLAVHQRVGRGALFLPLSGNGSILPRRFRAARRSIHPEHPLLFRRLRPGHHAGILGGPPRVQLPQRLNAFPGKAFSGSRARPLHGSLRILHPGIMQMGKSLIQKTFGGLFLPGFQIPLDRASQFLVMLQRKAKLLGRLFDLRIIKAGHPKRKCQQGKTLFSVHHLPHIVQILTESLFSAFVRQVHALYSTHQISGCRLKNGLFRSAGKPLNSVLGLRTRHPLSPPRGQLPGGLPTAKRLLQPLISGRQPPDGGKSNHLFQSICLAEHHGPLLRFLHR